MERTATAETLFRSVVLPVRAVRAGLGAAADYDPAVIARRTAEVEPKLAAAAEHTAKRRARLEAKAAKAHRKAGSAIARRYVDAASADALARVDEVHAALGDTLDALDR